MVAVPAMLPLPLLMVLAAAIEAVQFGVLCIACGALRYDVLQFQDQLFFSCGGAICSEPEQIARKRSDLLKKI